MIRVSFMIIGTMKCGTTSLAGTLARHPDICFSNPKEPNFFNKYKDWKSNLPIYEALFRNKKSAHYGEGSTAYTKFPKKTKADICDRLFEYNPALKFIYIIRHPVTRAVSHYLHSYRKGLFDLDFSEALRKTEIIDISRYYFQLEPYIRKFGRDQILILKFEDFIRDQHKTLGVVAEFLGINPNPLFKLKPIVKNKTDEKRVMSVKQDKFFNQYILPIQPYLPKSIIDDIKNFLHTKNSERPYWENITVSKPDETYILEKSAEDIIKLGKIVSFNIDDYLLPPS